MPLLDVTDVILDPLFCEPLTVYRQVQSISAKGRTVVTKTLVAPAPYGVVLPLEDAPMVRGPDAQQLPRLLEIHTPFRMRGISKSGAEQYQPDEVVWKGGTYQVNKVSDLSQYGQGFIKAEVSAITTVEDAPT